MIKVISIFGTRPEAIKMAPVIRELEKHPDHIVSRVCVTAQHREMLDQVLDLFGIKPDYDLNVMQMGQTPTAVASVILVKLEALLDAERPDWVLVQGDTTTVMAASIAAYFARAKVGHIEAGLRTYDKWQPFPEEINRRVAGVIADLHFAPTEWAAGNLLREGVARAHIIVTGNTVIDAVQQAASLPYDSDQSSLSELVDHNRRLILVTAHRRENFGKGMTEICRGLRRVARHYDRDVQIIYPVHLNPNVQQPVYEYLEGLANVVLLPPLDYRTMVWFMKNATLVLTDSGGIQEEAPGFGVPVLVLRDTTERPEGVEAGTVKLIGASEDAIVREVSLLLENVDAYQSMAQAVNPYGDGHAAERIVETLLREHGAIAP